MNSERKNRMDSGHYLYQELTHRLMGDGLFLSFFDDSCLDGMWYWDLEEPLNEWLSPKFWQLLGYDPDEKQHLCTEWQELVFEEDLIAALDNFDKHCADPSHPYDQILRLTHREGHTVWVRCRGVAIYDEKGSPIRMLGVHTDITEQKKMESKLAHQNSMLRAAALTDPLTGLSNRKMFNDQLAKYIDLAKRQNLQLSIIMYDTDNFKFINDSYGHPVGDEILKRIGETLQASGRGADVCARLGGDEFIQLLYGASQQHIDAIAQRIKNTVSNACRDIAPTTISVGCSTFVPSLHKELSVQSIADDLLYHADKALYCSKKKGKNSVSHCLSCLNAGPQKKCQTIFKAPA